MFCCCAEEVREEHLITLRQDVVLPKEVTRKVEPAVEPAQTAAATSKQSPGKLPADEPTRFTITVERAQGSFLGIDLVAAGKVCMVDNVTANESLVGEWNRSCASSSQVRRYDRLMSVNGRPSEKGKDALDAIKASSGKVSIEFERPNVLEVKLPTGNGQSHGLRLKTGPTFLLVTAVEEGHAKAYNSGRDPKQQIKASSRITTVNGKTLTGDELMKEFQRTSDASQDVDFKVLTWS